MEMVTQTELKKIEEEVANKRRLIEEFLILNNDEYEASASSFEYGGGTIKIRHKIYNWTYSTSININVSKSIVDFDASCGGWHKGISPEDRLKTIVEIYEMVRNAIEKKRRTL